MGMVRMVALRPAQREVRRDIGSQPDTRGDQRLPVIDRLRRKQALHRFKCNRNRRHAEQDGAREAREFLNLARTETEASIGCVAARDDVRAERDPQRERMRSHVHAVCQQRHRAGQPTDDDLGDHHYHGDRHRQQHAPLARRSSTLSELVVDVERLAAIERHEAIC